MDYVHVVLGPFESEAFARGLRHLLIRSGDFEIDVAADLAELRAAVATGEPSVVIVEGGDPDVHEEFLDTPRCQAVVVVEPSGARAFVSLDDPDWDRLAHVIHAVAAADARQTAVAGRVVLLDTARLATLDPVEHADPGIDPLAEWLDLTFAVQLAGAAAGDDMQGVPGWSMAPREALNMLGSGVIGGEVAELVGRLEQADRALIVDRTTLSGALRDVADRFAITDIELRLLCLVLAPEIDGRYGTAIGVLQNDLTRRRPGLTLLAGLVPEVDRAWELRPLFGRDGTLCANGLVEPLADAGSMLPIEPGHSVTPALAAHLVAAGPADAARALGASFLRPQAVSCTDGEEALLARLVAILSAGVSPLLSLHGPMGARWFDRIASALGSPLVRADLGAPTTGRAPAESVLDWAMLATLHDAGLLILGTDAVDAAERRRVGPQLAAIADRVAFLAVDGDASDLSVLDRPVVKVDAPPTTAAERERAWAAAADRAGLQLSADGARRIAATVRLEPDDIDICLATRASDPPTHGVDEGTVVGAVQESARGLRRRPLPPTVRRVDTVYEWDDLVLPAPIKDGLRAISAHVLHAGRVLEDWGYSRRMPYGHGVAALFSGPSGTGKTMAARVLAGDLGVDLLQVDLSKAMSKYIGETEKNLDQAFDAAEREGSVLLFDEADAIFGKRTAVADAHDRYANVEVAYLLQRMESFAGLAILTTNLRQNIDKAFLRRLRFAVEFPQPTTIEREAIWKRAFPADAPLAPDLDVTFLARRLPLTGGSIQQIALHAAFAASADRQPIGIDHVVAATRRELVKVGMLSEEKRLDEFAA